MYHMPPLRCHCEERGGKAIPMPVRSDVRTFGHRDRLAAASVAMANGPKRLRKETEMRSKALALGLLCATAAGAANAQSAAPTEIKIGALYASSGPYASISMPVFDAFKLWVDQVNATGGAEVKPFGKKIPIKLIAYDDQSSTATAATLYNQLISQDHVDLLIADSGSVLTSVGVPIAKEHKQFLFDVSGTGAAFFTDDNPYIALMADPVSTIWPHYISDYLDDEGVKQGVKTVAILYSTNDFTGTQAAALKGFFEKDGKVKVVYYQGVPTTTSNYTVLINNIAALNPDALLELGYVGNDIAFLRNLQDSGNQFRFVFTIYGGTEKEEIEKNVGISALTNTFSYVPASNYEVQAGSRHDAEGVPRGLGQEISVRVGRRLRRQRDLRLHDRPGGGTHAGHHQKPRSDGHPRCRVRAVRQTENPRRHLHPSQRRRPDRRGHSARAVAVGRQGTESRRRLSARPGQRQGGPG